MSLKLSVTLDFEIPLEIAAAIQQGSNVDAELENCLKLADQDAAKTAVVAAVKALSLPSEQERIFTVFVVLPNGKTRTVHVHPSTTVKKLAVMIEEKEGVTTDRQLLRHRGKVIWGSLGNSSTMVELDIHDCSTIHLSIHPRSLRSELEPFLKLEAVQDPSPTPPPMAPSTSSTSTPQNTCQFMSLERSRGSCACGNHRGRGGRGRRGRHAGRPRTTQPPDSAQGGVQPPSLAKHTFFSDIHISVMGAGILAGHTITLRTVSLGLTLRRVAEIISSREGVLLKSVSLYADGQLVFSGICAIVEEVLQLRALAPKQRSNLRAVVWTENVDTATQPLQAASTGGDDLYN